MRNICEKILATVIVGGLIAIVAADIAFVWMNSSQ
jgi:hypothetical protein